MQKLILLIFGIVAFNFSFGQDIFKIQKELKENPKTRIQNAAKLRKYYADYATDSLFTLGTYLIQQGIDDENLPVMMYGKLVLSSYNNFNGKTESSIKNLKECIVYYKQKGDFERLADAQNLLGIAYIFAGDYKNAASYFVKSIKNADKLDENNESFIAQLNLSEVYIREDKLDLAEAEVLAYIEKCKKIKASNGLKKGYDFLAKIYMKRENMDMAIYYYEKALKLAMKDNSYLIRASSFNNIAIAHFETGKLDLSYTYFNKALDLRLKLNRPKDISESYYNLGDWHFYQDLFDEALKYYQLSLNVAKKNNQNREIADAFEKISMCYEAKGNYKSALEYAQKHQEIEANNYKRNQSNESDKQRIEYEIEREEQFLRQKRREDKIQRKVTIEKNRGKIIVISFTVIVSLMTSFYFLQTAKKNKQSAKNVSEKEFDETVYELKMSKQKWQELENLILSEENPKNHLREYEINSFKFNSIGDIQTIKLYNGNYLFWETTLSKIESYILKNQLIQKIATETNQLKINQILESQNLVDKTNIAVTFVSTNQNQLLVNGKNELLIHNSEKMSFLNENETAVNQSSIIISERFKNELLATENWDKFLSQIEMLPRMSNEMALETLHSCWSEMLQKNQLGILIFFSNESLS